MAVIIPPNAAYTAVRYTMFCTNFFLELTPNVTAQQAVRDINFINKAKQPSISKNMERDKTEPITAEKVSLFTPGASPLSRQTNFKRK